MKKYILFILLFLPIYGNAQINLIKTMNASNFMSYNNQLYFTSENGINVELWKTDGTTAGTVFIKTIGGAINNVNLPIVSNNLLYFIVGTGALWRTDGTAAGTFAVVNMNMGEIVDLNGTLIFTAQDTDGNELWKTNGTAQGTTKIIDFLQGGGSGVRFIGGSKANLAKQGNYIYFTGDPTAQNRQLLCKTDGTASGTQIVNNSTSIISGLYSFQNKIFALTRNDINITGNCSVAFLFKIIQINNGNVTDFWIPPTYNVGICGPYYYTDLVNGADFRRTQNSLFFLANNNTVLLNNTPTIDIRRIDGNTATLVKNFPNCYNDCGPNPFAFTMPSDDNFFENIFYFQGSEPSTGLEVWRSDGTPAGTFLLKDIASGTTSSLPLEFRTVNGSTYFIATGSTGRKLYKTDGTPAGTTEVSDPNNVLLYPNSTNQLNTGNQRNYYSNKLGSKLIFVGTSTAQGNPNALFSVCTTPIAPVVISSVGSSICVGSSATLTAAGCTGTVNWSTGATTNSITVSPTVNTTYTATCTDVCGVSPNGSFPITVNPLPTVPSISQTGTKIICPRASFTLSASGCNSSTITWSNNTVGSSITVNSANTYTATCTNVCGTSSASTSLIVLEAANTQTLSGIASAGLSHASQSISSSQTINNTLNVAYQAGNNITLNTDFISDIGSTFNAEIGSACPITDGLVAYYNLDNNFTDLSGNGHNATYASAILTTGRKGVANTAYSFNGVNHRINLGGWFNLQEFTLSMWLNAATTQNNSYAMIIDNNHGSNISFNVQQDFTINNRYYFAVGGNPTHGYSPFSLTPNQWEHIVLVKGNGFMKVFKNGVLLGSVTHLGLTNYTSTVPSLCLGAYVNNNNYIRYWAGKMDDIKIYNRALSDVEVGYLNAE
jgi:ELWxxDGT repeat protein